LGIVQYLIVPKLFVQLLLILDRENICVQV